MTPELQGKVKEYREKFIKDPGYVIEFGSLNVNGGVRHLFEDARDYVGIDMERGPGVDIVMNCHEAYRYFEYEADTIICMEMLEHDDQPWLTMKSIHSLLSKGGYLIISSPMNGFPEHRYPKDYFRYMKDAYTDWFFKDLEILDLSEVKSGENSCICGIAKKPYKIQYELKNIKRHDTGYCW